MSNNSNEPSFSIQRIYLKDCSFETPSSPEIFRADWQPRVDFELQILHTKLSDEAYEVVIAGTVTAHVDTKVAFLAEAKQAGIFSMNNIPAEQLPIILNVVCPNILFPYFREIVSSLTVRGTFPQLTLDPINFEALFQQRMQQESQAQATDSSEGSSTIQ